MQSGSEAGFALSSNLGGWFEQRVRMRICYYFRYINDPMGKGIHARSLVEAWHDGGNEVTCLPNPPLPVAPDRSSHLGKAMSRSLPRPVRHRLLQAYDNARSRLETPAIMRRLEASRPEVLVARWCQFDHALDRLVAEATCPVVAEVNAVMHKEMLLFCGTRLPRAHVKRELAYLRAVDFAICVSDEVRDQLIGLGVDSDRSAVVPNGVDCRLFFPGAKANGSVVDWAEVVGKQLVAYCGTSSLVHDTRTLFGATELLADRLPGTRFLFVGPLHSDAYQLTRRRPDLADRIRVTGAVPHATVPSLLAPASLLWGAFSNVYGSPLKVLEYMAMGKPTVVAGEGQVARMIDSANCGRSVAIGDADALADAAAEILDALPSSQSLGARGREWVETNATREATSESILRLVKDKVL